MSFLYYCLSTATARGLMIGDAGLGTQEEDSSNDKYDHVETSTTMPPPDLFKGNDIEVELEQNLLSATIRKLENAVRQEREVYITPAVLLYAPRCQRTNASLTAYAGLETRPTFVAHDAITVRCLNREAVSCLCCAGNSSGQADAPAHERTVQSSSRKSTNRGQQRGRSIGWKPSIDRVWRWRIRYSK
jgi:hypothetical protein